LSLRLPALSGQSRREEISEFLTERALTAVIFSRGLADWNDYRADEKTKAQA
jgi:hypothetical protein